MVSESVRVERSGKMLNRDKCAVLVRGYKIVWGEKEGKRDAYKFFGVPRVPPKATRS